MRLRRQPPISINLERSERRPPGELRSAPRVGLVLGGGGTVGAAYHAGALAALETDLGWDVRAADVIVGTSAGALVAALLRLGVPATDLAALTAGVPAEVASESLTTWIAGRPQFAAIGAADLLRAPRLPRPSMLLGLARLAAKQRVVPFGALSMIAPDGRQLLAPTLRFLDTITDGTWPAERLLVCAVRRRDWRRTVFSSDEPTPSLSIALAASCAVPGYFAGVRVHGDTYVDGGVISATNADVLADLELDLVIVISPMTGRAPSASLSCFVRSACRRTLDAELRALRSHDVPTVVIEPSREVTQYMPMNVMSERASAEIMRSAFFDTADQIAASALLRSLRTRNAA